MKKFIIISLAVLAIISPFIVTYMDDTPGLKEASFSEVLISATSVVATIFVVYFLYKKLIKNINGYVFILSDWEDRELSESITKQLLAYDWKVLPPSLDFYITNTTKKDDIIAKYLKIARGAIILIGENSKSSPYFISTIKTIKKSGIKTLCFRTSPSVEIPSLLQRSQIIPVISKGNVTELSALINFFLKNRS